MAAVTHRLHAEDEPSDRGATRPPLSEFPLDADDMPFRVEVWDEAGEFVQQVVAITASPSIGYAAYYAATREFVGRAITLRHRNRVLSRWTGQAH